MSLQPLFPSSPLDHSPKPTLDSTSGELTGGPDWDHGGAGLRPLQQRGDSGAQQWMVGSCGAEATCSSASSELPSGQQVQNAGGAQLNQNPGQGPMNCGAPGHDGGQPMRRTFMCVITQGQRRGEEK